MLHLFRDFAKTWIAKVLLGVLVVSFGAFGINNVITGLGSTTVARIGDEDITSKEFQRAYQAQMQQAAQQIGKVPTSSEAMAMGIPNGVISGLADQGSMNKLAQNLGVGVSEDQLAKLLQNDPAFQNTLGGFDKDSFEQVLQQNGYTQAEYLDQRRKEARRQQVTVGLFQDAVVPQTALDLVDRYQGDTRTLDYFVLNATNIPAIPDPTDADLTTYLKAHQAEYRTKETRTVDVMTLSPAILASAITIPDDQIEAEYNRTKADLVTAEKRDIKQAVLTDAQATALEAGKTAGKSFDDLVKASGLNVTDLGLMAKTDITDSTLADAAFGMKQGDFAIIPGIQGKRAITVASIQPGGQTTLADAKANIAKRLATQKATTEVGDDTDQIEDLRAGKQPLSAIAGRYHLKVTPVTLAADGDALSAVPDIADADRAKVATAVFNAKEGAITPSVQLSNNQNVWFDLKSVAPARDQTLAEVRDAVTKAWTQEKTDAAMKTEAEKVVADLKAGKSFNDVASGLNQLPILSEPITRQGDRTGVASTHVLDASVARVAFGGGQGHYGYAVNGDGDYVVFRVEAVNPASTGLPDQVKANVQNTLRESMYGDFVTALRQQDGLRINQGALDQAVAFDPNGG